MKKSFLIILTFLFVFCLFGCNKPEPDPQPVEHVCLHVCPICNKCLDPDCNDPKCSDKCLGHVEEPTHTHEYSETWEVLDDTYHYKTCTSADCNETIKEEHNFVDGKCSICGYTLPITKYNVTFIGFDNEVLKVEEVISGNAATAPTDLDVDGYLFTGWDKDFSNITSDLTIYAIYSDISKECNIIYDLNDGTWGYNNKKEYIIDFLKDFYAFVNPDMTLHDFIYNPTGSLEGRWQEFIGGSIGDTNKLLYENDIDLDNDDYFFNSSLYKEKWYPLSSYVKNLICKGNKRFGGTGGYEYGALDFYRYIIGDPYIYLDYYGGESVFYGIPEVNNEPEILKFTYNDGIITLHKPLSSLFIGWFNENDELVETIDASCLCDVVLTAKWEEVPTHKLIFDVDGGNFIESLTLTFGESVTLPTPTYDGMKFAGWYLNDLRLGEDIVFIYESDVTIKAKWIDPSDVYLTDLMYSGKAVTYRNSNVVVQIPSDYVQPETQFRAAWVSSYAGDFTPSSNKETMKKTLTEILDVLEAFNMNAIIFHIRTHNQAFYKTNMTYIKSSYGTYSSFETWDYLTWLIDECHKRGIEFHAWLNPYRVVSSGATSLAETAKTWKDYPNNPASDPANMLMNDEGGVILDPGLPHVRQYIIDICLEVMEKYDVDAIHFDDYFYIKNIDDSSTRAKYNTKNLSVDDFRREQVDIFIKDLSTAMRKFNQENNRHVQLGISPTGIYRNGNGTAESGSNTSGYAHYGSPLYADTLKWAKNEWIDYLLPQSYWGFTHKSAGYADVMDWWNLAMAGTRCNLYSGLGIYMSNTAGSNYSWGSEPYEVANQILYTTKLENVKGISFYNFSYMKKAYNNSSMVSHPGMKKVVEEYWTTYVNPPKTMASGE